MTLVEELKKEEKRLGRLWHSLRDKGEEFDYECEKIERTQWILRETIKLLTSNEPNSKAVRTYSDTLQT